MACTVVKMLILFTQLGDLLRNVECEEDEMRELAILSHILSVLHGPFAVMQPYHPRPKPSPTAITNHSPLLLSWLPILNKNTNCDKHI